MADTIQFKRGAVAGIPTALSGEPLWTTDSKTLYVGDGTTNYEVVMKTATQTLTNKTLTSPTLTTPNIGVANGTSLTLGGNITLTPVSVDGNNRTLDFGQGYGVPAIYLYNPGSAGNRWGWGLQPTEMQFFAPVGTTNHFSWNKGGDLQTSGTNEVMRLTLATRTLSLIGASAGGLNATIDFGNAYGNPAIWLYNSGSAGGRFGWGLNPGEMQFFTTTGSGNRFSFNKGGDLQPSGTNEVMSLDVTTGVLAVARASLSQLLKLTSYTNSSPADGDLWYDGTNLKFRQGGTTRTITWT